MQPTNHNSDQGKNSIQPPVFQTETQTLVEVLEGILEIGHMQLSPNPSRARVLGHNIGLSLRYDDGDGVPANVTEVLSELAKH